MAKVSMTGTITCQDGKRDEMEQVLRAMVEAARLEPGIEIYSYHRGAGNSFSFFALMADEEAMRNHGQTGSPRFRVGSWVGAPSWACRRRAGSGRGGVGSSSARRRPA